VRVQELNSELTDKAKTDDQEPFAEGRVGEADRVQGNGSDDTEGRFLIGNRIRNPSAQMARNANKFRMGSVADDAVAERECSLGVADTQFANRSHVAVTQGQGLLQLGSHSLNGWNQAVRSYFCQYLPHAFGLLTRLIDPTGFGEIDQHLFGAE
jgi:hypothetical protein